MSTGTSVVRISRALDERLDALAVKTGRRKSYYASKAIEQYLEDCEDYLLAVSAYEESKGKERYSEILTCRSRATACRGGWR